MEMFHRVIEKAENLEVVESLINNEDLPLAIQRFCPDWVILSLPISEPIQHWIGALIQADSTVRFIFFSPDHHSITMKWQMASEEDLSNLSLGEFIHLLDKDLQHI
jgi:hypothetical protein